MQVIPTKLHGVLIIEPTLFCDERGAFMESFNAKSFANALKAHNLPVPNFVQDNHSISKKGVLRGLHFQTSPHAQGKLVRVVQGRAWDVAVDIRPDSPTFGQWVGVELSAENHRQFWIPAGFAHGFVALEDNTQFLYKTTDYYAKDCEQSILWCDKDLAIDWQYTDELIISDKDQHAKSFASIKQYLLDKQHAKSASVITPPSEKIGQGKRVILAMPKIVGLYELFIKNLEYHGFEVLYLDNAPYHYKHVGERLKKLVSGNKKYKIEQKNSENIAKLQAIFDTKDNRADFSLFIHALDFSPQMVATITQYAKKNVHYQWDGLRVFPQITDYTPYFDDFFVFDAKDLVRYEELDLKNTTNFYFDYDNNLSLNPYNQNSPTLYFVGLHWQDRTAMIVAFLQAMGSVSDETFTPKIQFFIKATNEEQGLYQGLPVQFMNENLAFSANLEKVKNCDVLVDFVKSLHSGLSFRFFESIYYGKKLITNNPAVALYDLYHPNNIFIWDGKALDTNALRQFLQSPYQPINEHIKAKYSFQNWIKYLFDLPPYAKLDAQSLLEDN